MVKWGGILFVIAMLIGIMGVLSDQQDCNNGNVQACINQREMSEGR
jgi:hypothetical protein